MRRSAIGLEQAFANQRSTILFTSRREISSPKHIYQPCLASPFTTSTLCRYATKGASKPITSDTTPAIGKIKIAPYATSTPKASAPAAIAVSSGPVTSDVTGTKALEAAGYSQPMTPISAGSNDFMNAPLSTLPAPLESPPPRKPEDSRIKYVFNIGKGYLKFYKTGAWNAAIENPKLAAPVLKKLDAEGGMANAINVSWLTRSDLQLIIRYKHDFKRVPVFALVFAICGEFTPLFVMAFTSVVPYTCRVPQQIRKDRIELEKARESSFTMNDHNGGRLLAFEPGTLEVVENLSHAQLLHCSTSLGFHSRWWPTAALSLPPSFKLRNRLRKHANLLEVDDMLLKKGGGATKLSVLEVEMACVARGLRTVDVQPADQQAALDKWLKERFSGSRKTCYELWLTRQA